MEPLVSVVIPVYKTEKYVVKSVNSILTQSYKNTEIIIVDDGSPDSCPKICDDLQKSDNRIIVIHKENGGLSSARNTGIDAANGKYVFFLDSDDTLYADAVSDMVKIAEEENSDAVIPDSYYKVFETDDRTVKAYHFTEKDFSCDPKVFALNVLIGKGRASRSTAVLYSMKCIKENNLRFPLGKISEDFFFNLDFLAVAGKISVYEKPSLYNLKREGSLSASYHKGFFDTILEMDEKVKEFTTKIDDKKYKEYIGNKRHSLLVKNTLVYAMSIMKSEQEPYGERVALCISIFENSRVKEAVSEVSEAPFFPGRAKTAFIKLLFGMVKKNMYRLACFTAYIAFKLAGV